MTGSQKPTARLSKKPTAVASEYVKSAAPGAVLIAIGGVGLSAARDLTFGSSARMGPGYFPTIVSGLIVFLGVLVAGAALTSRAGASLEAKKPIPWRAMALITAGVLLFAMTIEHIGLFLASYILIILSCYSAPGFRRAEVLWFPMLLAAFVVMIFVVGLGISVPTWPTIGWISWT